MNKREEFISTSVQEAEEGFPETASKFEVLFSEIRQAELFSNFTDDELVYAQEVGKNLRLTGEEFLEVKQVTRYDERAADIALRRKENQRSLREKIRKILIPIISLAFSYSLGDVVSAQEQSAATPMTITNGTTGVGAEKIKERLEKAKRSFNELFNTTSPLAYHSEKFVAAELIPEDIDLLKRMRLLVLTEANEIGANSGKNSTGKGTKEEPYYLASWDETGPAGGDGTAPIPEGIEEEVIQTHTHPIKIRKEFLKEGAQLEEQPFLLPPSFTDVSECLRISVITEGVVKTRERVVDSMGVWEVQCHNDSPLRRNLASVIDEYGWSNDYIQTKLDAGEEDVNKKYGLDLQKMQAALGRMPEDDNRSEISVPIEQKQKYDALISFFLTYADKQRKLFVSSADASEKENALAVRNLIDYASQNGLEMSYTPFKE